MVKSCFEVSCILRRSLLISILLVCVTSALQDSDVDIVDAENLGSGMNLGQNESSSKISVGGLTYEFSKENGTLFFSAHQIMYSGEGIITLPSDCDEAGFTFYFGVPVFRFSIVPGLILLVLGFILGVGITSLIHCGVSCCKSKGNANSGSAKAYQTDPVVWKTNEKGQGY